MSTNATSTTTALTTTSSTIPELALPVEGEPWDPVVFTDSFGWGVAEPYAALAMESLGVPVIPHDAAIGDLEASKAMVHLNDGAYPYLSDVVRNAEIIVVFGSPEHAGDFHETCAPPRISPASAV